MSELSKVRQQRVVKALRRSGMALEEVEYALQAIRELHAHALAEKLRDKAEGFACANDHDFESAAIANEWDAAADLIDPEVSQT